MFQFAAQSPWSRIAVFVGSQCIRHQINAISRRLRCDHTETAVRLWRMQEDCATNHIKCNGNDVVDCFEINFILQKKMIGEKVMIK